LLNFEVVDAKISIAYNTMQR